MIRVSVHSTVSVTVTRTPGLLARVLLGREESTRNAQRIRVIGGTYAWVYVEGSRDVERDVAEEIERELTRRVVMERVEGRGGMTRVRSDVILRRFLDGWTFAELQERLGTDLQTIERAIRNALNRGKKKR